MAAMYGAGDGLLHPKALSAHFEKASQALSRNPFFDYYNSAPAANTSGERIEMALFEDSRKPAPIQLKPGSVANTLDNVGGTPVFYSPVRVFNEFTVPFTSLENLRQFDNPELQVKGSQTLDQQFRFFAGRHRMTRMAFLSKMLNDGIVYYNGDGNILESSSGNVFSANHNVGATHKAQLAHASNSGSDIIGTKWPTSTALIMNDLEQIREAAEYDKAPQPKHVWLHSVAKQWLRDNADFTKFVVLNSPQAQKFVDGFTTDELVVGDWTFHFYNGTYQATDDTIKPIIQKTKAIITPDINDGMWFAHFEHMGSVPKDDRIAGSITELLGQIETVYGDFSFMQPKVNALSVSCFVGSNFFYGLRDVNAIWCPTIDF